MSESRNALLWRVRQVALRSDLRIALAKHESVARSLARCADALVEHLDVALCAFWWLDETGDGADLIAVSRRGPAGDSGGSGDTSGSTLRDPGSRPEPPAGLASHVRLDETGIGAIVANLTAQVTNDLASAPELAPRELVEVEQLTSFAGYPLLASDRTVGALTLYGRSPMAEDALDVMAWVADVISVTLESRRVGEELREALVVKDREVERRALAQRYAALQNGVSQLLANALSFNEVASELVRTIAETLGWEVAALWHLEVPANLRQVTVWHAEDDALKPLAAHLAKLTQSGEHGIVSEVTRSGAPVYWPDAIVRMLAEDVPDQRLVRCALGVPVSADGLVTGALVLLSRSPCHADDDVTRTLGAIGSQIGIYLRRKLIEEQLIQAQKMEAVGKLAGGVAHDFNNILTVITGYAAMSLEQVPQDNPLHDQAHEILSAAERATSLVNQLLAFSRKQVFHPRLIDLNIVVGDMERMLRRLIGEDVRLITRKPDVPSMVRADLVHVEQVIVNLAVNARDAMPQGGRLYIEIEHVEPEPPGRESAPVVGARPQVRVTVRDTGLGMSEDVRKHAFEPFFTTKDSGKGTGLGLATVYGIVRQNGGQIRVDSEAGKGAQFTVSFPRVVQSAQPVPTREQRATASRGTETVLLVEDEKPVRRLARNILKTAGYDVIEAGSAEEALQIVSTSERPIRMLLTDVVMPGMNGVELSHKLRGSIADLRVLYMSGYAEDSLFDGYAMGRGVAFLEKPFTPAGLAQKVRQVLDAGGPAAAEAKSGA